METHKFTQWFGPTCGYWTGSKRCMKSYADEIHRFVDPDEEGCSWCSMARHGNCGCELHCGDSKCRGRLDPVDDLYGYAYVPVPRFEVS